MEVFFRKKELENESVLNNVAQKEFIKKPWHVPTEKCAPKASVLVEDWVS